MVFNFLKKIVIKSTPNSTPIEKLALKKMEEELKNYNFKKNI